MLALLLGLPGLGIAQARFDFSRELAFAQYLQDKDEPSEALKAIADLDTAGLSAAQKDSLYYERGWLEYTLKLLDPSAADFLRVDSGSARFYKSRYFAAYENGYLGRLDDASGIVRGIRAGDTTLPLAELSAFEEAGLNLLARNYAGFDSSARAFSYRSYAFSTEERHLVLDDSAMRHYRRKSPWLAGFYSAVVPGLGKVYAGRKLQGISAFLPVVALGALTYEAYRKGGVKDARFWIYGSAFTVFYIGNIWGSALSVHVKEKEFFKEYDTQILFDLHIPLRNLFD